MRIFTLVSASALLMSGCLTAQENPNYKYSSQYKGDESQTRQYASDTRQAQTPTAVVYDTAPSQPIFVPDAVVTAEAPQGPAPTDQNFEAQTVTGTPGYMAMQGEAVVVEMMDAPLESAVAESAAPSFEPLRAPSTSMPIEYDMSQNLVPTAAETYGYPADVSQSVNSSHAGGKAYVVKQGDTIYSLSRKTCVGVTVIQSMNGLDENFAINIGQVLTLPDSVC